MKKYKLTPQDEIDFKEWMEDGNATKIGEDKYLEQTTQYSKEFTLDELRAFFKREFRSDNSYSTGGVSSNYEIIQDADGEYEQGAYFVVDADTDSMLAYFDFKKEASNYLKKVKELGFRNVDPSEFNGQYASFMTDDSMYRTGGVSGKVPRYWNKLVREYEYFVFNTRSNKVWAGNEYENDAKDELKEFLLDNPELPLKVLTKRAITNKKINPLAYDSWARSNEQFAEIRGEEPNKFDEGGLTIDDMDRLKVMKYLANKYPDYTNDNDWTEGDDDYFDEIFYTMVDDLRERYNLTSEYSGKANDLVEDYMQSNQDIMGLETMATGGKFAPGGMTDNSFQNIRAIIKDLTSLNHHDTLDATDKELIKTTASVLVKNNASNDLSQSFASLSYHDTLDQTDHEIIDGVIVFLQSKSTGGKFAEGGMVGDEVVFNRYGDKSMGEITEILADGTFIVHSGMSSRSIDPRDIIEVKKKKKFLGLFDQGGTTDFTNLPLGTRINAFYERRDKDLKGKVIEKTPTGYKIETREYDSFPVTYDMITRVISLPTPVEPEKTRKRFLGLFDRGGSTSPEIHILDKGVKYDKAMYKGVFSDYDDDGLQNLDDPNPTAPGDTKSVEERRITESITQLLNIKEDLDTTMYKAVDDIAKISPKDSVIYARTKTPYSIIAKLIKKRLLTPKDPKKGLTDLIGMTIVVDSYADILKLRKFIESGKKFEVYETEDFYETPLDGYMAVHYILIFKDDNGSLPVELQLKTKRMKAINQISHKAYAQGNLDKDALLNATSLANKADKGDADAIKSFELMMQDPEAVELSFFKDKAKKYDTGGEIDDNEKEEWTEAVNVRNFGWYQDFKQQTGKTGFGIMQGDKLRTNIYGKPEIFATKEKALFKMSHVPFFKGLSKEEKEKLIIPYIGDKIYAGNGSYSPDKNLTSKHNQYHSSKHLSASEWEKWNDYVKTGKINGKPEKNIFAVARHIGVSVAQINAYEIEQRSKGIKYAGGGVDEGGLYDYKIGDFAYIRKADYNEIHGQIIDISNFEMAVNLGQGIKGSQAEIYATIVDENGKEHSGHLMPKNYSNGGSMYAGGGFFMDKNDPMYTIEEIGRLAGLRPIAVAEWGDKNNVNLNAVLTDLKARKITGIDLMGAVVGSGRDKRSKQIIAEYSNKFDGGGSTKNDQAFLYRLLNRLQTDNDYYLGAGNRYEKHLWAGSVDEQIKEMKSIWNKLRIKPEWLSMDDILDYETKMKNKYAGGGEIKVGDWVAEKKGNARVKVYEVFGEFVILEDKY